MTLLKKKLAVEYYYVPRIPDIRSERPFLVRRHVFLTGVTWNCWPVTRDWPRGSIDGGNVKPPLTNFVATGYVIVKRVHCLLNEVN